MPSAQSIVTNAACLPSHVLIIGEALVDRFADARIVGGAPFNVARNLAALGAAPHMITRIGNDEEGALILNECQRFHLPTAGVQRDPMRATGNVEVCLHGTEHRFSIAANAAWDAIDAQAARTLVRKIAPSLICFGTLAQRTPEGYAAIDAALSCSQANARPLRVLDLNLRPAAFDIGAGHRPITEVVEWSLSHADIVKVNDDELSQLIAWFVPAHAAEVRHWGSPAWLAAIARLLARFPLRILIVTRGAEGYLAFDCGGAVIAEGAACRAKVTDTVGAGDAFTAIVILGLSLDWSWPKTLERANQFAAEVCTLRGAVSGDMVFYWTWAERWQLANVAIATGAVSPIHS